MEKEEILLGMEMGRLEIEPIKVNNNRNVENPFTKPISNISSITKSTTLSKESKCSCLSHSKVKPGIYKKKHNKILKEPVLNILKKCGSAIKLETDSESSTTVTAVEKCNALSLCTLVDNCNQLKISSSANIQNLKVNDESIASRWWKNDVSASQEQREPRQQSNISGSCSQQALNPPCDVTIDELASYFETLVHIPKKMSTMAEMMYI